MQNSLNDQMDTLFKPSNVQTLDETVDDFKEIGTGVLTGTIAIPSDIVTGAEMANTFLADYTNNPMAMLLKDNLQTLEKQYGRGAFDKGFEEITGIKSDVTNPNQLVGEILSPTGAFLTPLKLTKKLSDAASGIYDTIKNTLSKSDFVKSDLVTEGAYTDPIMTMPKKEIDINRPKIDLSTVSPDLTSSKKYIEAESNAIQSTEKFSKTQKIGKDGASYEDLSFEQKQKLYDDTGIYRGEDGKLKTNISMKEVSLKDEAFEEFSEAADFGKIKLVQETTLKNIINHADLFKMFDKRIAIDKTNAGVYEDYLPSTYGPIGDVRIKVIEEDSLRKEIGKGGAFASYDPVSDIIYVPKRATPREMLSSIIHEVQHAIQHRQGFQGGDSTLRHLPKGYFTKYKDVQNQIKNSEEYNLLSSNFNRSEGKVINPNMEWLKPSVDATFEDAMTVFWKANNDPKYYANAAEYESGLKEYLATHREEFADDMRNTLIQLAKREAPTYNKYNKINLKVDKGDVSYGYLDSGEMVKEYEFTAGDIALINHLREGGGKSKGNIMYTNDLAKQERIEYGADRAPTPASLNTVISTRKVNFENHMKMLARLNKQQTQLDNIYNMARKRYINSFGEKEARYAQMRLNSPDLRPADDMFFRLRGKRQGRESVDVVASERGNTSMQNLSPITQEIIFIDNPNTVKNLFLKDTNMAQELGGQIRNQDFRAPRLREGNASNIPDPISIDELNSVRKEIYNLTQMRYKDLPEEITVYRVGKLNQEDGISSFSLDPRYNVETNLPWQKGQDQPLISYKVKKSDILASPDFAEGIGKGRKFDEEEVIIDNDKVKIKE